MSLHVGNDVVISSKQIVTILNICKLTSDSQLIDFINGTQGIERRRKIGKGPYRSAILCKKGTFYFSPIDAKTLAKRIQNGNRWLSLVEGKHGKASIKDEKK